MKVYCFGNPYVKGDDLALVLADELSIEGVEFIKCDGPDFLLDHKGDLVILDVAKGIEQVKLIDDISMLENSTAISLHDFDLQFFLKLLDEMGELGEVKIIAVPLDYDKEKAKEEVTYFLESL